MIASFEQRRAPTIDLQTLSYRARYDGLTGLCNRATFEESIDYFFEEYPRGTATFFLIDIDNFKTVNDELGHQKGDEMLKQVATVLRNFFRENDIVSRFGGDEFAVFAPSCFTDEELETRMADLGRRMRIRMENVKVSCSVGVCRCPSEADSFNALYGCADIALMAAKRFGKDQYQVYSDKIEAPSRMLFRNMDWLLHETTDVVMVCDCDTYKVLYLNRVGCQIAGMSLREAMDKPCYQVLWGRSSPCEHCIPLQEMEPGFNEYEMSSDTGDRHYIIKGKLVDWGNARARIQYLQDNTQQARLLRELARVSEDRKQILDLLPGGLLRYQIDGSGEFDFVSESTYAMLGYSREEFREKFGDRFQNMVWQPDHDRVVREIESQLRQSNQAQCDFRMQKKDGSLCWVHCVGRYAPDAQGTRWFYLNIVETDGGPASCKCRRD